MLPLPPRREDNGCVREECLFGLLGDSDSLNGVDTEDGRFGVLGDLGESDTLLRFLDEEYFLRVVSDGDFVVVDIKSREEEDIRFLDDLEDWGVEENDEDFLGDFGDDVDGFEVKEECFLGDFGDDGDFLFLSSNKDREDALLPPPDADDRFLP